MDTPGGGPIVTVCPQNSGQGSCSNHCAPAHQNWNMESLVVLFEF